MVSLSLRYSEPADAGALAPVLRPEDVDEVRDSSNLEPEEAIALSLRASDVAFSLFLEGAIAAIFGVGPSDEPSSLAGGQTTGVPWLVTSRAVERHPRPFLEVCRKLLPVATERYPVLCNFVDTRHRKALRWARWMGFQVGHPIPFGPRGKPFHPIVLRRPPCASSFQ
ncbi:MAG TPA: hypothetical protein VMK12_26725 [Anaeromyxobacteraceae bacterium]|nr:hypothetical protein [Anaeromyxobacteraceae bacterium]